MLLYYQQWLIIDCTFHPWPKFVILHVKLVSDILSANDLEFSKTRVWFSPLWKQSSKLSLFCLTSKTEMWCFSEVTPERRLDAFPQRIWLNFLICSIMSMDCHIFSISKIDKVLWNLMYIKRLLPFPISLKMELIFANILFSGCEEWC